MYATGPMQYGNIRSSRYAVAGTLVGARRLARELFGRHSCVIAKSLGPHDATGASEIRYLILPLSLNINPPSAPPGGDGVVGIAKVEMLPRPDAGTCSCAWPPGPGSSFDRRCASGSWARRGRAGGARGGL